MHRKEKFKMKNIFKSLLVLSVFAFSSCEDEDAAPLFLYEDLEIGAYARLVSNTGNFLVDLDDLSSFTHSYVVEFVDADQGRLVESFTLNLVYDPVTGDDQTAVEFRSFTASDFTMNADGFMETPSITITSSDLLAAFSLTEAQLSAGESFTIEGNITHQNGRTFNAVNSSATVEGAFFQGYFNFDLFVGCQSDYTGTYNVSSMPTTCNMDAADNIATAVTGTVEIESAGSTVGIGEYSFSDWTFGTSGECFGSGTGPDGFMFIERCGVVTFDSVTDEFGTNWSYTSTISGNDWIITWSNPDSGQGSVTTITFPGGVPFTVN